MRKVVSLYSKVEEKRCLPLLQLQQATDGQSNQRYWSSRLKNDKWLEAILFFIQGL